MCLKGIRKLYYGDTLHLLVGDFAHYVQTYEMRIWPCSMYWNVYSTPTFLAFYGMVNTKLAFFLLYET